MTLPIPQKAIDQHTLFLGKTRSGKSSKMRLVVESLLDRKKPVIILDPKGDWWGLKSSADGRKAGYPVVIFGGEHADVPINSRSGGPVAELVATGNRPCIIDLGGWMVSDRTRFFIDFASTLFKLTRGEKWLVIDEVHNFAPQGKVLDPEAGKMLHWANRLASEGAGKGITLLSASQRPQKVHKDYVTSHETLVAMRVIHPLDRGAVKEWIDGCGDPAHGKDVINSLAEMPRSDGWVWSPEIGFGPKRITFPLFSTYDSFAVQKATTRRLKGWASVDLEDVKGKLAAAVEEAKANDPKELRAEIARLKKAVIDNEVKIDVVTSPKQLAEAEKRGYERGIADYQAWNRKEISAYEGAITALFKAWLKEEFKKRDDWITTKEAVAMVVASRHASRKTKTIAFTPKVVAKAMADELRTPPKRNGHDAGGALPLAERKIIAAIWLWRTVGIEEPTKVQLAFAAEYHPRTGGFRNALGAMRGKGWIDYVGDDRVRVTGDLPKTDVASGDFLKRLSSMQRRIFDAVRAAGGRASKEVVAGEIGVHPRTGNYRNGLGALRGIGVIDYDGNDVVMADWVEKAIN